MQYLKEEVKNSIMVCAEQEFFEKGFKAASLRSIAKNANTTLGNIYNYFENKQAILDEIVDSEYKKFEELIKAHEQEEKENDNDNDVWDVHESNMLENEMDILTDILFGIFSKRFYILFTSGEGQKYEDVRSEIRKLIVNHLLHDLSRQNSNIKNLNLIIEIICTQFIESMLMINKLDPNEQLRKSLIKTTLIYTFSGIVGIIKDGENK